MIRQQLRAARGFTLVELMVGLAVGLFVALAAISIFVSTRTLQTVSSAESRMGENSRLAMELLRKDFRSAGFQGCNPRLEGPPVSLLTPSSGLFLDGVSSGLGGSHGDGTSSFTPALNATLAALPQPPLATSDVVSMRVPVEPMSLGLAVPMTVSTGVPNVGANTPGNTIVQGDVLLISNCKAGAIFQVTEADPFATGLLTHTGGSNPGNASSDFGNVFRGDAAVYRLQTHHYYVAASVQRPGTFSLWRYTYPTTDGSAPAQEVVQGIDRMLVTYGIDDGTGNQTVSRYVSADGVTSWDSVVAARIQLLSSTVKDGVTLSTQSASFAGGTFTPSPPDKRLRTQVTEVVTLRNRAP